MTIFRSVLMILVACLCAAAQEVTFEVTQFMTGLVEIARTGPPQHVVMIHAKRPLKTPTAFKFTVTYERDGKESIASDIRQVLPDDVWTTGVVILGEKANVKSVTVIALDAAAGKECATDGNQVKDCVSEVFDAQAEPEQATVHREYDCGDANKLALCVEGLAMFPATLIEIDGQTFEYQAFGGSPPGIRIKRRNDIGPQRPGVMSVHNKRLWASY